MLPILIRDKKAVNKENPNEIHALLTHGFEKAARGIDFLCQSTKRTVRVFGLTLAIQITKNENQICFDEDYSEYVPSELRNGDFMKRMANSIGQSKVSMQDSPVLHSKAKKFGINYCAGNFYHKKSTEKKYGNGQVLIFQKLSHRIL